MITTSKLILLLLAVALLGVSPENVANSPSSEGPEYTSDGQLMLPQHYRDWGFLTSDFHTTSDPAKPQAGEHRLFNNIFVNPGAYKGFLQTGTWPDKAMLVVEQRTAEDMGSSNPNQKGTGQSSVIGIGVHVKDETRFPEKWAFFGFQGGKKTAGKIPATAACYSCHAARGAVDTTFVQFYPTLLPTAKSKNTLSPAYHQELETHPSTTK
jgi:hypothetical protein